MHVVAQIKSPSREPPTAPLAVQGRSSLCLAKIPAFDHGQVLDEMLFCLEQIQ